jgi:hypothetical protein
VASAKDLPTFLERIIEIHAASALDTYRPCLSGFDCRQPAWLGTFSPGPASHQQPSRRCDLRPGRSTCYDRQGPSIGLTQTYFGVIAANRLTAELRDRPTSNDFRLSNGTVCELMRSACWSDGWQRAQLNTTVTQQLFGALPPPSASGASGGLQGLQTPRAGVVCDPGGQSCYDQAGLSMGITREYFGAYAEQAALRNLGGQAPPRQFKLSNGSACDLTARTC